MGQNSCLQMIFSIVKVYKRVKEEGGIELADSVQALVVQNLVDDGNIQSELESNCSQALDQFMDAVNSDEIDEVLKYFRSPRDMQEPVWTRWMTTVKAAMMVVGHWVEIYAMMVAIKNSKKSSSHLGKTAADALSLMKTKAADDDRTPVFYAQLLFLKGFACAFFNNAFDLAMRADSEYGRSSFGYTSRMCVERCYLARKQLDELLDDSSTHSWKKHPDFCAYREAIADISELGEVNKGGREYFIQLPTSFLKTFIASYRKLVESCWRHWKIVLYIIAGNPTLANLYLNWLVVADEGKDVEDYCFPSKTIYLKGHVTTGETVEVDTRACLEYITERVDPKKVLNDPLISDNKALLWQMAAADPPVDVFDPTTWSSVDYKPLCDMIHTHIVPHMCQNQRKELCANACSYGKN